MMKRFGLNSISIIFIMQAFACSADRPLNQAQEGAIGSGDADVQALGTNSLLLRWKAQTAVNQFHVFYIDDNKGALEIDLLKEGSKDFNAPQIKVDSTNMEAWPDTGTRACFYIMASASGIKSDPSEQACITL